MASASLSTPGVFESIVLASRCISCSRKSSFLPSSLHRPSSFVNCCRWLRSGPVLADVAAFGQQRRFLR